MDVLFLAEEDIRRVIDPRALVDALSDGFSALTAGKIEAPNRNEINVAGAGFLLAMPAWQPGLNMTVKMVSVFQRNPELGVPGHQALICLFDPQTGTPVAVMDGRYITAIRTAGGAMLSVQLIARKDARILAIIGAGVQGESHLKLFAQLRDFDEIRIASSSYPGAQKLAAANPGVRAVKSREEAVRNAGIVCLCTTSSAPVIHKDWLSPGVHITSVGYAPPGSELPDDIIRNAALFVETRRAFMPPPVGCCELAGIDPEKGVELGEILMGKRPGRQDDFQITVYKSMGHAMEDMVAANLAYRIARQQGRGKIIQL